MSDIIRTPRDGCFEVRSNTWGAFLVSVTDPESNATLEPDALKSIDLHPDIAPIPAALWSRWVLLCFHFVGKVKGTSEVSCRLLRHEDDKSKWRILVPQQSVDGAAVRVVSFDEAIDIETGEVITSYPPQGWVACGSSHSHNTMSSFFSDTDDHYELGDPGLHIVVGDINVKANTYTIKASVTANKRRFEVPFAQVLDATPVRQPFHPDVLQAVTLGIMPAATAINWAQFDRNKNGAAKQRSSRLSLNPSLNAGNGYATSGYATEGYNFSDEDDLMGRPLFRDIQVDHEINLFDLAEQITTYANDCIACGDDPGIISLLRTLRECLDEIEFVCSPNFDTTDTDDDESETDSRPVAGHPAASPTLCPGEW